MNNKKKLTEAKARAMQQIFYEDVLIYLMEEYKPRIARLFTESPIAGRLVDLVNEYYWGGNTVQFTAGQVADLLKSKYKKKK